MIMEILTGSGGDSVLFARYTGGDSVLVNKKEWGGFCPGGFCPTLVFPYAVCWFSYVVAHLRSNTMANCWGWEGGFSVDCEISIAWFRYILQSVPTIYVLSKNIINIKSFWRNFQFLQLKKISVYCMGMFL